ncbi:MAG: hypothetical protein HWN66_19570 [Candidatus Helarchaeota archaeon]|nr:hypothetical protein [Candidatus Helarchaeota archaeon]
MAVLGIAIQSQTGIPLFLDSWSDKLVAFHEGSPILISGFLAALSSFASSYKQDISYIRLRPVDYHDDPFGIDGVYSFIGKYMILIFTDPYQFHEMVNYKIQWIYNKVLFRYENMLKVGKVPNLTKDERTFIEYTLMDNVAWEMIYKKTKQLNTAADSIIKREFPGDVFGCFITSFDNSILYTYGMDRAETEIYLNNSGNKGSSLQNGEIFHNYVSLPGLEPRLVVMTNSGVRTEISDILGGASVGYGGVPYYYYMITDTNIALGPIVEALIDKFNAILI